MARNLEDRKYRIQPRNLSHPWWLNARDRFPERLEAIRPLLEGRPVVVDYPTAEATRWWAIGVPGWPTVAKDSPLFFVTLGNVDDEEVKRVRWPVVLQTSERERDTIEAAASRAGLSVATYLRDAALAAVELDETIERQIDSFPVRD